ncbi:MAG: TRAP transporter large permease [Burkholderiales bacterium]|nr:TRAP transporter large permease [Burkholderiales bacterium]MCC7114775.1 TRAP transporter large permease [Burkholderiales bacterium]
MTIVLSFLFLALMFLGMPVAFAVGVSSLVFFLASDTIPASIGVQRIATSTQSFPLLAVPLFVLAGNLMNSSGITDRIIALARALTGWIAGGLAQVAIVVSALMGGVSGSAVADAAMEARILGPAMLRQNYSRGFSSAVIAVGALITATIPPSIGLILYGFLGNVSIGKLFLGGVVPGILMTLVLMGTAWAIARRRGYRPDIGAFPGWREVAREANRSKWALLFPVFLVIGIRFGVFTPSEVGAFAVAYAIVVGVFAYRELGWKEFNDALRHSVHDIGMIMLIIMLSAMIGYVIALERVPQNAAEWIVGVTQNRQVLMSMLVVFILLLGMFLESTVIVLLLTPILVPIVVKAGIDPVHFGLVMMTSTTLGSMTPPVGVAMYTVCGLLDTPMDEYTREALPLILAVVGLIFAMAFFPPIVTLLPELLM